MAGALNRLFINGDDGTISLLFLHSIFCGFIIAIGGDLGKIVVSSVSDIEIYFSFLFDFLVSFLLLFLIFLTGLWTITSSSIKNIASSILAIY